MGIGVMIIDFSYGWNTMVICSQIIKMVGRIWENRGNN